jgi:Icc-related predicted phosphoesterase
MKILIFSDIHSDLKALERLMAIEADHYIAAGDLVSWARGLEKAGEVMKTRGSQVWVMPGNHESEADIARFCDRYGFRFFHGGTFQAAGFHVAGLGYSNPTPFDTPGEYSEAEIARRLEPFAGLNPLILVCHCPPRDTPLDEAGPGRHFGSSSVRAFLDAHQPRFFFCGHIHEAEGVTAKIGKTFGVNVGKRGYLLELDKIES